MLANGAAWLQAQMEAHAAEVVRYIRPGEPARNVIAIPGQIVTDQTDVNGFVVRTVTRDFTIVQSFFAWSTDGKPHRNDEIHQTIGGRDHVFVVNADSFATAHFEETDPYGVAFRIHTRKDREHDGG